MTRVTLAITRIRTLTECGNVELEVPDGIAQDEESLYLYVTGNPAIIETAEAASKMDIEDEEIEYEDVVLAE